jgi:hypothetical protein
MTKSTTSPVTPESDTNGGVLSRTHRESSVTKWRVAKRPSWNHNTRIAIHRAQLGDMRAEVLEPDSTSTTHGTRAPFRVEETKVYGPDDVSFVTYKGTTYLLPSKVMGGL